MVLHGNLEQAHESVKGKGVVVLQVQGHNLGMLKYALHAMKGSLRVNHGECGLWKLQHRWLLLGNVANGVGVLGCDYAAGQRVSDALRA